MSLMYFLLLVLGCGDKDGDSGAAVDTAGPTHSGSDGGATAGDGGASSEAPVVTSVDAWCYEHSTGDKDYIWQVEATFTDPQGDDTARSYFDGIAVKDGTTVVAEYAMTCPDPGVCGGSFRQSLDDVRCTLASAYTISVRVQDEDDNWSAPQETTGRLCPSADPF